MQAIVLDSLGEAWVLEFNEYAEFLLVRVDNLSEMRNQVCINQTN